MQTLFVSDWWKAGVDGNEPDRECEPQAGYYRARFVEGGPWVAVQIWAERDGRGGGRWHMQARAGAEVADGNKGEFLDVAEAWAIARPVPVSTFRQCVARNQRAGRASWFAPVRVLEAV